MAQNNDVDFEQDMLYLLYEIHKLDKQLGVWLRDASALTILQKHPCYARVAGELAKPTWENIDSLYRDKHDYAKKKIIDRLVAEFGSHLIIKSEYDLDTGNVDIVLTPILHSVNAKGEKKIGVEVKGGSTVDIFEIERYIFVADYLLLARIPTHQIELLDRNAMRTALRNEILSLTDKVRRIADGNRTKVEGPWCRGCPLNCEFKKHPYDNNKAARLEFSQFKQNLDLTIENLIAALRKLI